ncbi:MAG: Crp/Fnr family transcriptional regulator, partial [Bacteroidota bacterium]
ATINEKMDQKAANLLPYFKNKRLLNKSSEFLFQEGQTVDLVYCIKKGSLFIYKNKHKGTKLLPHCIGPGHILGLNAIHQGSFLENALALNTVEAIFSEAEVIREALQKDFSLKLQIMKDICEEIKRVESNQQKSFKQQISKIMLDLLEESSPFPKMLPIPLSHPRFNHLLGNDQKGLNQAIQELSQDGLIRQHKNKAIEILYPEKIHQLIQA